VYVLAITFKVSRSFEGHRKIPVELSNFCSGGGHGGLPTPQEKLPPPERGCDQGFSCIALYVLP